jgi:hypothetical protein
VPSRRAAVHEKHVVDKVVCCGGACRTVDRLCGAGAGAMHTREIWTRKGKSLKQTLNL